jgi:hypothetical protein
MTAPLFPPVAGESAGQRVFRVVRFYDGCSLSNRRDELAALVGEAAVTWTTNCETFAIGVYRALGLEVPDVQAPLKNGLEGSVVEHVAARAGGWQPPSATPPVGALMHYRSNPYRKTAAGQTIYDDHVEFMGAAPDEHGGGGRANNLISIEHGDVRSSVGRPLYGWIDPEMLGLPDANVETSQAAAGDTIPIPSDAARDTQPPGST